MMKAMILAAGEGTRLLPLTTDLPKALVPFNGIPMLEILMRKMVTAGFKDIVINVHHFRDKIIQYVNDNEGFGAKVMFSEEEILLDTGGGIRKAMQMLGKDPVLFHNVDVLTGIDLKNFYDSHLEWGGAASLATMKRPTSRSLICNGSGRLVGWQYPEKRIRIIHDKSRGPLYETAFSGVYVLDPNLFKLFPDEDAFSLTPWLLNISVNNHIRAWDHSGSYWYDLGTVQNLRSAEKKLIPHPEIKGSFIER